MVTITENLPEEKWRCFVDNHPNGNIFHTPEMFAVFSHAKGHSPRFWAATNDENILAIFVPVEISFTKGIFRPFTSRSVVYGGVLTNPELQTGDALNLLIKRYQKQIGHSILFTEVRNLTDDYGIQSILQNTGFEFEAHNDYIVNLAIPVTEVWNNIHKTARRNLKRAISTNRMTIREIVDRQMLPQWYRLIQKSFSWNHVPLADISLFEAAFDVLYPKHMIQFLIGTTADGQDIAASVALLYKGIIYGWYRGFDRKYSHFLPNDQMVWHVLEWGAQNGFQSFDFGGAGKPGIAYGPRNFKAKFGGKLVNHGRNTVIHTQILMKLGMFMYRIYRLKPQTLFDK